MALTATTFPTQDIYFFKSVTKNEDPGSAYTGLSDWIKENDIIHLESETVSARSNKSFGEIVFSLTKLSAGYFPLLRGLAASGKTGSFVLQVNSRLRNFTFVYDLQDEAGATSYLVKILGLVRKEVQFKRVLRKFIFNQEKYKLEERLLLSELTQ